MVVSILHYNKFCCNLIEFRNDRFDGGGCDGADLQTDQKRCSALLLLGRRGRCRSLISTLNSHVTVQEPKVISREVRYCANKKRTKKGARPCRS